MSTAATAARAVCALGGGLSNRLANVTPVPATTPDYRPVLHQHEFNSEKNRLTNSQRMAALVYEA
jgi:hypothetical protein